MQLIVAEKPSVARDIARVLGVRPQGDGCFENDRYVVTWCIGHLVELDEPASYDARWRSWRIENLPMLPSAFRLRAAKHARQQLRAVSRLLGERRFQSVINACDAGREGELIFRYVYQYAEARLPIERLWVSSLTDEAIRRGFAQLRPGAQLDALADAARSRSEADWLVGMNATRAVTARGREAGHDALYSIGRVQTPTLAMLVARERQIREFVARPYWEVRGDFTTAQGARFHAMWRHGAASHSGRFATRALADELVARDRAVTSPASPTSPIVERVRARTVREAPPLLFDLTSLQRTANRRYGFSAARTLEIAQALYERHKVLTYPRTDARHLSTDVVPELPQLFASLATIPDYQPFAQPLVTTPPTPSRRIVDDTKVGDHHAIIPTAKPARSLDGDEGRIYDMVVRRVLGAFYPDAEFAVVDAWIRVGALAPGAAPPKFPDEDRRPGGTESPATSSAATGTNAGNGTAGAAEPDILGALPAMPDRYLARGRTRIVAGWQDVAGIGESNATRERDGGGRDGARDGDDAPATLPPLVEGQPLGGAFRHVEKRTTPPPRYTEASLLGAMESAGKTIDDEALRTAMKDRGLGTPATRAAIIETLLRRSYIVRDRQALVPTLMGIALVESLVATPESPIASLASPELTGTWEARLARIARGEESRAAFMADIARYVANAVDAIRGAAPPTAPPPGSTPPQQTPWGKNGKGRGRYGGKSSPDGGGRSSSYGGKSSSSYGGKSPSSYGGKSSSSYGGKSSSSYGGKSSSSYGGKSSSYGRSASSSFDRGERSDSSSETRDAKPGTASTSARAPRASRAPRAPRANTRVAIGSAIDLGCPACKQGNLIAGARGWGCARWRDGCRFVIWFETAGKRITAAQLRDLVTRGKTRKATFEPVSGKPQSGCLVLDPSAPSGAARFEPT